MSVYSHPLPNSNLQANCAEENSHHSQCAQQNCVLRKFENSKIQKTENFYQKNA